MKWKRSCMNILVSLAASPPASLGVGLQRGMRALERLQLEARRFDRENPRQMVERRGEAARRKKLRDETNVGERGLGGKAERGRRDEPLHRLQTFQNPKPSPSLDRIRRDFQLAGEIAADPEIGERVDVAGNDEGNRPGLCRKNRILGIS